MNCSVYTEDNTSYVKETNATMPTLCLKANDQGVQKETLIVPRKFDDSEACLSPPSLGLGVGFVMTPEFYVLDMWLLLETKSRPNSHFMERQHDINMAMRTILYDWMHDVHIEFKTCPVTLFLAFDYADKFIEKRSITRHQLQLVGCSALFTANKINEVEIRDANDFRSIADHCFTIAQLHAMGVILVRVLDYKLFVPTVWHFVTCIKDILSQSINNSASKCNNINLKSTVNTTTQHSALTSTTIQNDNQQMKQARVFWICLRITIEKECHQILPSQLAVVAVYLVQRWDSMTHATWLQTVESKLPRRMKLQRNAVQLVLSVLKRDSKYLRKLTCNNMPDMTTCFEPLCHEYDVK